MNREHGIWHAIGAYVAWGSLPFYWKQIEQVPALELIGHRIAWSFITLLAIIVSTGQRQRFAMAATGPRVVRVYAVAAVLISINWFVYVWSVNNGFIVESSLGYYITPLVSVLFGVVLLHERMRPLQWVAVTLAATGVLVLAFMYGSVPWIALTLAFSFGTYGLVKKRAPLGSMYGLTIETAILLVPAAGYLFFIDRAGHGAFMHAGARTTALLAGAGLVTTVPLLLFASASQRIPLSLLGVCQYIAPTLQLLTGVLVYEEPFTRGQFMGFTIVWTGLVVFGIDGWIVSRVPAIVGVLDEGAG